jgi:hypothetical protein
MSKGFTIALKQANPSAYERDIAHAHGTYRGLGEVSSRWLEDTPLGRTGRKGC